jgi:peptidoglycan/xylan/chitin deacetylase (PgdA/CDA1 family)
MTARPAPRLPIAAGAALAVLLAVLLIVAPAQAAQRTVYLTFDDGPLDGTSNVLSVLEQEQVPATLFMVGQHVLASPERKALLARAKAMPLVTIGNHSFSHANNRYKAFYADTEGVVADMLKANAVLGLTVKPVPARLPGRDVFRLRYVSRNDLSVGEVQAASEQVDFEFVAASDFDVYGWDFEWFHDGTGKPVQKAERLVDEIARLFAYGHMLEKDKLILLMHDQMFQDKFDGVANLTALIAGLRARGYAFGHIAGYSPAD